MDNKKFGQFILQFRKEKGWTQLELAEKLNITDKAVSKWERGVGFPDIKMIEPLAEVFNVSVLEIMRSERVSEQSIPAENAAEAINIHHHVDIRYTSFIISTIIISFFMLRIHIGRPDSCLNSSHE